MNELSTLHLAEQEYARLRSDIKLGVSASLLFSLGFIFTSWDVCDFLNKLIKVKKENLTIGIVYV